MRAFHIGVAALAAALVAGCGGGSDTRENELAAEVKELKEEVAKLEKRPTDDDLAEARQQGEAAGRTAGERAGNQRAETAERETREAKQEAEELREAIGKSTARIKRDQASRVRRGIADDLDPGPESTMLAAMPVYNRPAQLTVPNINRGSLGSSLQGWRMTAFSDNPSSTETDTVEIYSNIKADDRIQWISATATLIPGYDTNDDHFTPDGKTNWRTSGGTVGGVSISAGGVPIGDSTNARYAALPSFPSNTSGPQVRTLVDRGATRTGDQQARHPERWSAEISGTLRGASGTFRCTGTSGTDRGCTIEDSGEVFVFGSGWTFYPSSRTTTVRIPDSDYMWFGWWSREIEETPATDEDDAVFESITSYAHYGGRGAQTSFGGATGTAEYTGPVVGQYAIVDDLGDDSDSGRFTATIVLDADFGNSTAEGSLSGTINRFSNDSTWEVSLKQATITSGVIPVSATEVSWSIGEDKVRKDGGQWRAEFYSEAATPSANSRPDGVAGSFTAHHGEDRRMIGAFGAERRP